MATAVHRPNEVARAHALLACIATHHGAPRHRRPPTWPPRPTAATSARTHPDTCATAERPSSHNTQEGGHMAVIMVDEQFDPPIDLSQGSPVADKVSPCLPVYDVHLAQLIHRHATAPDASASTRQPTPKPCDVSTEPPTCHSTTYGRQARYTAPKRNAPAQIIAGRRAVSGPRRTQDEVASAGARPPGAAGPWRTCVRKRPMPTWRSASVSAPRRSTATDARRRTCSPPWPRA